MSGSQNIAAEVQQQVLPFGRCRRPVEIRFVTRHELKVSQDVDFAEVVRKRKRLHAVSPLQQLRQLQHIDSEQPGSVERTRHWRASQYAAGDRLSQEAGRMSPLSPASKSDRFASLLVPQGVG